MIVLNPLSMVQTMATATHKVQFYVFFTRIFFFFSSTPTSYYYLFIFFLSLLFSSYAFLCTLFFSHSHSFDFVGCFWCCCRCCCLLPHLLLLCYVFYFSSHFLYIHLLHFSVFGFFNVWIVFFFASARVMIVSVLFCFVFGWILSRNWEWVWFLLCVSF